MDSPDSLKQYLIFKYLLFNRPDYARFPQSEIKAL